MITIIFPRDWHGLDALFWLEDSPWIDVKVMYVDGSGHLIAEGTP